jgi:hypothetical protein
MAKKGAKALGQKSLGVTSSTTNPTLITLQWNPGWCSEKLELWKDERTVDFTYSVFVCFVWISEQTAIISLYSIN